MEGLFLGEDSGCERKFVATAQGAMRFLEQLDGECAQDPQAPAPINYNRTTYLDTADFRFLRSSETGTARKLRIREYASAPLETVVPTLLPVCFLELKESRDGTRAKTRLQSDAASLARLMAGEDVGISPESDAYRMFRELIQRDRPVPTVTSWYCRTSRISQDRSVRVTVDSGLCFTEPVDPGTAPTSAFPEHAIARVPFSIVEVKTTGDVPPWLLSELGLLDEVPGFSKFEQGMAHLLGAAP